MKRRLTIMRPKLFIAAAGISLLLAYPVSLTLKHRDDVIQSQEKANHSLRLQIEKLHAKPVATIKPTQQAVNPPVAVSQPTTPPAQAVADPPKPTVYVSSANRCGAYANLFAQYGWNVQTAMAICSAESKGDPTAVSPTDDYGLMQINHGLEIYGSAIYDPAFNIKIAYTVKYLGNGWLPWTTYTSGKYLSYL